MHSTIKIQIFNIFLQLSRMKYVLLACSHALYYIPFIIYVHKCDLNNCANYCTFYTLFV